MDSIIVGIDVSKDRLDIANILMVAIGVPACIRIICCAYEA